MIMKNKEFPIKNAYKKEVKVYTGLINTQPVLTYHENLAPRMSF